MVNRPSSSSFLSESQMRRGQFLKWLIRIGTLAFALALALPALALRTLTRVTKTVASGDQLVYATGNRAGDPISMNDVPPGSAIHVFPKGKSNNQNALIELVHLPQGDSPAVVAYSAICTHLGCTVSATLNAEGNIGCPCHGSIFDPAHGGAVVRGPAARPLPGLPISVGPDGGVTAAGSFDGPIGPQ